MNKGIMVVKVGTAVLTQGKGMLDAGYIELLVNQISQLAKLGYLVILVTSGAIGAGMETLGLSSRPKDLSGLQACAAIGQGRLMRLYEENFSKHGIYAAQILLTQEDFSDRRRFLNARNTILALLNDYNAVPVINENDTIATEEIKFGDNDKLSALVTNLTGAHTLVMLTNVDGLYSDENKKIISLVTHISSEIEKLAKPTKSALGSGGMISKLSAVKIAINSGATCVIANGRIDDVLLKIEKKESTGTTFLPSKIKSSGKKSWIQFSPKAVGTIFVDDGAKAALVKANKSLLAAGIKNVSGKFEKGDVVYIAGQKQAEFAKGVVNFSSEELQRIKGLKTALIEEKLQRKVKHNEVVHRDNLVILEA